MALPTSCTPARLAVVNALTVATALPRSLVTADLYKRATPANWAQNPADLKKTPRAFVLFRDPVLDGETENGSSIVIHHTVVITTWWWSGNPLIKDEFEARLADLEDATNKLRAALCYPGALTTSPSAADTGLCGHALRNDSYRAQGPDDVPVPGAESDRALRVIHFFRASIDTLQPT